MTASREYSAKWREKNRERIRASARKAYHENPVHREKRRAESRRNHLRRNYGIDTDGFREMLNSQGGGCAACGTGEGRRMVVDHDHGTGEVRGILCLQCNTALGQLEDSQSRISALLEYIKRHQ